MAMIQMDQVPRTRLGAIVQYFPLHAGTSASFSLSTLLAALRIQTSVIQLCPHHVVFNHLLPETWKIQT